jgi:GT2 family glycosyltransferase
VTEFAAVTARRFAVCIVTHDDAGDVAPCLESLAGLENPPAEVIVADCASGDASAAEARAWRGRLPLRVLELGENRGFAGGMNAALAAAGSPWILSLNADARPDPPFVERLLDCALGHPRWRVGAVTGRLLRFAEPGAPDRLDACGMRLTWTWRHLDRGAGEVDRGQLASAERVFGATGAAALYRRAALDDVAIDGQIFDERFHSFREDAELCFRLRERAWEVLYEPRARARHRRRSLPERRSAMPADVNFHSLKNRYLLRIDHQTAANLVFTLLPALTRDLMALAWVLTREPQSRRAYAWLWRRRAELLRHRRAVRARRTVGGRAIDRWFFSAGAAP